MLLMTQHSSVAGTFLASWSWQCHLTYKDLDKTKRRNTLRVGAINPKIFRSNKPWAMIQRQHPYLKSLACNYFIASYLGVILVYCDTSEAEVSTWSPRKHDHNHLITNHAWGLSVTHGVVFFFFYNGSHILPWIPPPKLLQFTFKASEVPGYLREMINSLYWFFKSKETWWHEAVNRKLKISIIRSVFKGYFEMTF